MITEEKQGLIRNIELFSYDLFEDSIFENELISGYAELIKLNIKHLDGEDTNEKCYDNVMLIDYYIFTIKHHIKMNSIRVKKDVYNNVIFFNEMVNELTFKLK